MRNIFLFVRRFINVLFFLLLQVMALWIFFRYNRFHEAVFMEAATEWTGGISKRYNNIQYYFQLKKTNEQLVQENEKLRNLLHQDFEAPGSAFKTAADTVKIDSLETIRRYRYMDAKVVGNFVSLQTNYLMIHRGLQEGVGRDMGVVGPEGIVGRVVTVSRHFATVMTALNRQFKTSVKLKRGGERGSIEWDGKSPLYLMMKDIQKSTEVKVGDTVVTSELSSIFPANIPVGTVAEIIDDKSSNFYTLRLKTATSFTSIQYVYVVNDLQKEEKEQLEDETRKIK